MPMEDPEAAKHRAEDEKEDAEFESHLSDVKRYQEVTERCEEYSRTIALQKAKIETLELELQNAISNVNAKDLQINEMESKDKSLSDQGKKYTAQINQLNVTMQKLKQQNTEYFSKIEGLEKTASQLRQELDKNSQTQAKSTQESHAKDVKLNRMIEELEKYKRQLKEVKSSDGQRTDDQKRDGERLLQENKRLERQNGELLVAFKKQLKLIDILKRQKVHIESAKLLAFTEEEFVKTLELGDKIQ